MKKLLIVFICMFFFAFHLSALSFGGEIDSQTGSSIRGFIKESLLFTSGWMAGYITHDAGHYAVGRIEGADVRYDGMRRGSVQLWIEADSDSKLRNVALAGFGVQVISTELMLYDRDVDSTFQLGWLLFNIVNPVLYTLANEISADGHGDLKTVEESGLNSRWVEAVIVTHAVISGYRIYNYRHKHSHSQLGNNITPAFGFSPKDIFLGLKIKF